MGVPGGRDTLTLLIIWMLLFRPWILKLPYEMFIHMGVSENRGPSYSTLKSRILIIRTPKYGTPNFRKLPYRLKQKEPDAIKPCTLISPIHEILSPGFIRWSYG